jgi:predicted dehydrogenase
MMVGTLRLSDDVLASFQCGLNTRRRESYEIGGTDGFLRVRDAFLPGTSDVVIEAYGDNDVPLIHTIDGVDEYQNMVEHFADCVLEGAIPRYTAAEAAMNMRVIEALYASAKLAGEVVPIRAG